MDLLLILNVKKRLDLPGGLFSCMGRQLQLVLSRVPEGSSVVTAVQFVNWKQYFFLF